MYGNQITESAYHPRISVIGAVDVTAGGNVVLRIGELWTDGSHEGWQQTEHVVLKWHEVRDLSSEMLRVLPKRYGAAFTFRVERDVATELIEALGKVPEGSSALSELRDQLTDFVEGGKA